MLYIRLENFVPVEVSHDHPKNPKASDWAFSIDGVTGLATSTGNGWMNRNDITSFEQAEKLASQLTLKTNCLFLAADAGSSTSPQFDVFKAPAIGDEVSKSFNGDSYPEGVITKITPTFQITTSTGNKFRRFKNTAGFRESGRGFWMISGHVSEQNPSF